MTTLTEPVMVTAGPWRALLGPDGSLSRVSYDGEEILRGLAVVVRTNTWLTVTPEASVSLSETPSGFSVEVVARNRGPEVDFSWTGEIRCRAEGEFRYSLKGISTGVTSTNRIGLVALHSLNWAGKACVLQHSDGSTEATTYPELVSPHQPMKDMEALSQNLTPDSVLTITCEGEVFEMEDQRNWTDASYKVYSRPLEWPFPYTLEDGEQVNQAITLRVEGGTQHSASKRANASEPPPEPVIIRLEESSSFAWPDLGLGTDPTTVGVLTKSVVEELRPTHLRVDIVAQEGLVRGDDVLEEALSCGVPVELAVHVGVDATEGLRRLAGLVAGLDLSAVMVYDTMSPSTTVRAMTEAREALGPVVSPETKFFVGTDDNFTELNRTRIVPAELGAYGLCFAPSPQVHDSRERAIIETAEAFPAILSTARYFSHQSPIAVSPLAFKARRNIHAPGRIIDRVGRDGDSVDQRLGSMFSSVWLVSTLEPLITGGVDRVTIGEIVGPRGILSDMDLQSGSRSDLAALWGWLSRPRTEIRIVETGDGRVACWADVSDSGSSVLMANCGETALSVRVETSSGSQLFELPAYSTHTEDIHD